MNDWLPWIVAAFSAAWAIWKEFSAGYVTRREYTEAIGSIRSSLSRIENALIGRAFNLGGE